MRRILALGALVISAWYLRKRGRWIWLQAGLQAITSLLRAAARRAPAMLGEMAVAVRATAEDVRSRAMATASTAAGMARGASDVGVRTAAEATSAAAQGTADAAAGLQEAPGTVADQAEQAARRATGRAAEPATLAADVASAPVELAAGAAPERAAAPAAPSSIHTEVATPPSVHETVQAGLADSTDVGGMREDEAAEEDIAPDTARPARVAGTGTAMPASGAVRPLSPVGGESGTTGEPAGPSQMPSQPDSAETRTTGMERPPVVDRMAKVAPRTSGHFIGNKTTRVYHAATSGHLPAERNRVYFETQEEAIAAGFEPAENEGLDGAGS